MASHVHHEPSLPDERDRERPASFARSIRGGTLGLRAGRARVRAPFGEGNHALAAAWMRLGQRPHAGFTGVSRGALLFFSASAILTVPLVPVEGVGFALRRRG